MVKLDIAIGRTFLTQSDQKPPAPKLSLADALAQTLTRQITTGALKRTQQLPTEAELCEIHGVSRITIRRALDQLQSRGLIERIAGKGTFVSAGGRIANWQLDSIEDLVHFTAETRTETQKVLRWETVKPTPEAKEFLDTGRSKVYLMQAMRFMGRTPIHLVDVYIPLRLGELIDGEDLTHTTPLELYETKLDLPVQRVVEEVSAGPAPADGAKLLQIRTGDPVVLQELKFYGPDGPLQYARNVWHSKYLRRRYELARR
jgi:GntR family transcriptional regulator